MYNAPIVNIKNTDNLVYRDEPYNLEFEIIAPSLRNPITEEFTPDSRSPIQGSDNPEDTMYEFSVNKENWYFDENGNVKIYGFEVSGNDEEGRILLVTGLQPVKYSYRIYFNNNELKAVNDITEDREDSILIT